MKKFEKSIENRKELVSRLSELTGMNSRYTFVPRCAYVIGGFTVEKDGSLTVEDGADESILLTLKAEGLIGAEKDIPMPAAEPTVEAEIPQGEITVPDLGTEEWEDDEWDGEETDSGTDAEEQEVWQPETDIFAEQTAQEEATVEDEEPTEKEEPSAGDLVSDAEYEQEAEEEAAASLGVRDAEETAGFPLDASISFPISRHTVTSLTNLICTIHTRGPILSKATGGRFFVDKDLVDEILDRRAFTKPSELVAFLQSWSGEPMVGIEFDAEKVTFTGFTAVKDDAHLQTYMKLAAAMNKMVQTQKRVQAKQTDDSNEKYALRVWLVRLGLNGSDYKAERKILMERLSGHAAFRTKADEEKWKARQQAKKVALQTAKMDTEAGAGE